MDFTASLASLQAEVSCPICLEYLRDPVTIDCGHNFCCCCIHQCWEGLGDIFPCPICLHHCHNENLKKNTQLCHMTDIVKQLPIKRSKKKRQKEKPLCEKHSQVLVLFCDQDLELLCPQCRISSDHQDHYLMPIEQAGTSHRRKLKRYIEPLREQVADANICLEMQVSKSHELRQKVENLRGKLNCQFNHLKDLLDQEQDIIFLGLMTEEKNVEEKLIENNSQISDHLSTLKNLLSGVAEKCVQADLDLLTGIESIYNRYKNLKIPGVFSYKLMKASNYLSPQYFGLQKMISTFKEDLTLDPKTAHPKLIISEDRKSVKYGQMELDFPYNPERFTFIPAVLSSKGFDVGRHYWQVEVRGIGEWCLGVCKESFPRNAIGTPSQKDGCWQIQQETLIRDTEQIIRIGIFLDYDLGEVTFYSWNNRSYLYTFTDTFTEKLRPYFSLGSTSNCLTIYVNTDAW
ncbi:tripartite motif-containing protein 60-like [Trichechus manatus latirostris]|uniref:Tripartite motif-containing protein 60-like n=1 Tax=Trichechus manatus latirostris TaxID=127582 RepID=A0A2Y9DA99_TRIMA|nr:tripartite motif-containing protein 60-like [Trichechus manatus latirostris]